MVNFEIKGVEGLSDFERQEINSILEKGYEKIKRKTKIDFVLEVVVKVHAKGDVNRKKKHFSIKASVSKTVRDFEATSDGWDLHKAMHQALEALETEAEHIFRASEQHS
jgi:ribosome-associated translation inhibitor RaiA